MPFIWPPPWDFESQLDATSWFDVLDWTHDSVRSISGLVAAVNEDGVRFFNDLLLDQPGATYRIILVLSPGSPTSSGVLQELLALQEVFEDRLQFRLETSYGESTTTLCLVKAKSNAAALLTGPTPNFVLKSGLVPNFLMTANSGLLEVWRDWFGAAWSDATPLTIEATPVPHFALEEDERATHVWWEYETLLAELKQRSEQYEPSVERSQGRREEPSGEPSGESSTSTHGGTGQENGSKETDKDASDPLGLDLAALQQRLNELYAKGRLLTIDQDGRVPTLDCPIRPEWLRWTRERSVGTIKHRSEFRIPLLEEAERATFEGLRKRLTKILPRFTYLVGDRVRWIPVNAVPLLEREMAQVDAAGQQHLGALLKGDVQAFLLERLDKIISSANELIKERLPDASLTDEALEKILDAMRKRLQKANEGHFAPQMALSRVEAPDLTESGHISGWGQALKLLHEIALYPREAITTRSFMKGLATGFEELKVAMDVLEDQIWTRPRWADDELGLIEWLMAEDVDERQKCRWLLDLIDCQGEKVRGALHNRANAQNRNAPKSV